MVGPSARASRAGIRFHRRGPHASAGSCGDGVVVPSRPARSYHHSGSSRDPQRRLNSCGPEPGVERPKLKVRSPSRADRKSTRLNSSHSSISYAVFCLKKKKKKKRKTNNKTRKKSTCSEPTQYSLNNR